MSKLLWSVVRSALPRLVVIYLQFLPEMPGFVACGDLSENAGGICCRRRIAADPQTAVSFFSCNLGRVRVRSVA